MNIIGPSANNVVSMNGKASYLSFVSKNDFAHAVNPLILTGIALSGFEGPIHGGTSGGSNGSRLTSLLFVISNL